MRITLNGRLYDIIKELTEMKVKHSKNATVTLEMID